MINPEHYDMGGIQPIEYIMANDLGFLEGNIIKYVTRYKFKNGLEDLKKAQTYLTWLIENEEKKITPTPKNDEIPQLGVVKITRTPSGGYEYTIEKPDTTPI
jgi:hypothetical protein